MTNKGNYILKYLRVSPFSSKFLALIRVFIYLKPSFSNRRMALSEYNFLLQPSSLGGVGVFAAVDIPEGTSIFSSNWTWRTVKIAEVPEPFRKYCIYSSDDECIVPERFDRMEIGWYINHSSEPNITKIVDDPNSDEQIKKGKVIALCDIKAGEEILIDYNHLNEPETMKEDYYKVST